MEQRMDDVRAVLDAVGAERAALMGISEGGPLCALFAATYPQRTRALIMIGSYATGRRGMGELGARTDEQVGRMLSWLGDHWGEEAARETLRDRAPSKYNDPLFREWWESYLRQSASPAAVVALTHMNHQLDIRGILPAISAPTLIIHAASDRAVRPDNGRYLAQQIPGAQYVELDSQDHLPWVVEGDADLVLSTIERFLTGQHTEQEPNRALATVLYTDLVGSTERAAAIGDEAWRGLLEAHLRIARSVIGHYRGTLVKSMGDGILATFDGPARGIRAACGMRDELKDIGLTIRAGLHTGECEILPGDLGGIALHIGARVAALGESGDVLVSSTVKDLVAGSGITFGDRGEHALKGVPERWHVYSVESV
jgi:class 3 adenylate cyclase